MAKTNKQQASTQAFDVEIVKNEVTESTENIVISDDFNDISNSVAALKSNTLKPSVRLDMQYLELELNKPLRFVFQGVTDFVNQETAEIQKAVKLFDGSLLYITASTTIVQALGHLSKPYVVEITYTGEKALGGGRKLKMHKVILLN